MASLRVDPIMYELVRTVKIAAPDLDASPTAERRREPGLWRDRCGRRWLPRGRE